MENERSRRGILRSTDGLEETSFLGKLWENDWKTEQTKKEDIEIETNGHMETAEKIDQHEAGKRRGKIWVEESFGEERANEIKKEKGINETE